MVIHCIGNSHVWLFNGESDHDFPPTKQLLPQFKTYHLGPTIAYNFVDHHLPAVKNVLSVVPTDDVVMLVVGEVDCRWHLPHQAVVQRRPLEEVVKECVKRFFKAILEVRAMGYTVYAWGTHPITSSFPHTEPPGNDDWGPIYGPPETRNQTCVFWNSHLEELCNLHHIEFVSIYDKLVDENNMTKMEYLRDYCHLSNKCIPFVLDRLPQ